MTPRILLLVTFALAAPAAAVIVGCGVTAVSTDATAGHPTVDAAYDPGMADGGGGSDAAPDTAPATRSVGSPLCHASPALGCYPDDLTTAKACAIAPDGGPYNSTGGYDDAPLACHVQPSSGTDADAGAPVCTPSGSGTDGAHCNRSTDCAPRYECVGDGAEGGTCRRYCCSGNVECGTSEFCDIQPMTGASTTDVPVCIPITPDGGCHLLDDSSCPSTTPETCAVVREDGATSCVAIGEAKVGDPCDQEHCGRDLVCLGTPGNRRCYQLCHTADPVTCSATQTCKGGLPLIPDSSVGICQ